MRAGLAAIVMIILASRAYAGDETACNQAIAAIERRHIMPPRVLGTIAKVESGRPIGPTLTPWPWAINVEGIGHFYATKAEAITAVQAFRAAGVRSIDVGCMQINLAAHPQAFDTLEDAFDPARNAGYAARFLILLQQQTGRLAAAMTAYHSHTPEFATDYARRLLAIWPEGAAIGLTADPAPAASRPSAPASKITTVSVHGGGWPTERVNTGRGSGSAINSRLAVR